MPAPVFLIGGGRDEAVLPAHRPFIAALAGSGPIACFALDDAARWEGSLRAAGAADVRVILVSADRPPVAADLDGASGVYVAGGLTPAYQEALTADRAWLAAAKGLPYAGFSAGAAVAARRALVGGWRAVVDGAEVAVCAEEAGEDLGPVTIRDGLGLVEVMVDVHAAQWGTLGRLCHAVLGSGSLEGWAVDEGTAVECVRGRPVAVHGVGAAARIRALGSGEVAVRWFIAGPIPTSH